MRKCILLILAVLAFAAANAQFKQLAEGPVFTEPRLGFAKILQLKNGNTLYINIDFGARVEVRVYNAAYREISDPVFYLSVVKNFRNGGIEGVFEVSGNVAIFVNGVDAHAPTLYRVIIDGATGNLKDETKIAELNKMGLGESYAMLWGSVPHPDFFIRKDPNSDTYAVAMFNSFESERSKRIEIVVYGADNKELRRAYYASPEEKYKYMVYIDMAFVNPDKVSILAYAFNTAHSGGKESELILADLDKGTTSVSFNELNFSKDLIVESGVVRYDPVMKDLVLVANTKINKHDKTSTPYLALIDPFQKKLLRSNPISPSDKVTSFYKKPFDGLPQDLFLNDNGSFTVVFEQLTIVETSSSVANHINTLLGNMAVVNYSKTGEYVNDYIVPKNQYASDDFESPFYVSRREGTAQWLFEGNQYKSFTYLDGKDKSYLLFNDTERNNDKQQNGDLVKVTGISGSDAFYYPLIGGDILPKRDFMFGQPENKRDHNLALFSISDYDRKNNVYALLKLEKESGEKGVKVVWLQPQ